MIRGRTSAIWACQIFPAMPRLDRRRGRFCGGRHLTMLQIYTSSRRIRIPAVMICVNNCPARPTNGTPVRSSSSPGPSPMRTAPRRSTARRRKPSSSAPLPTRAPHALAHARRDLRQLFFHFRIRRPRRPQRLTRCYRRHALFPRRALSAGCHPQTCLGVLIATSPSLRHVLCPLCPCVLCCFIEGLFGRRKVAVTPLP